MNCGGFSPGASLVGEKNESGRTSPARPPAPAGPPAWAPGAAGRPASTRLPPPARPPPAPRAPAPPPPALLLVRSAVVRTSSVNATAAASAHTSGTFLVMKSPAPRPAAPVRFSSSCVVNPASTCQVAGGTDPVDRLDAVQSAQVEKNPGHSSARLASLETPP